MDGATNLQGIYDALSAGRLRASRDVKFGHSEDYYKKRRSRMAEEALADYVALRAVSSPYAEMFRRDKPEIAAAMDEAISEITKKLRG